jgi:hypothetical protein
MKKIPTVFRRDPDDMKRVLPEVTPGCEWVLAGEGVPTRKYDGTCCMFDGLMWWARREVKPGQQVPDDFRPEQTDEATGKTVGWTPMVQSSFAKYHAKAVANYAIAYGEGPGPGTYELCGPKINKNPEKLDDHLLLSHDFAEQVETTYLTPSFEALRDLVVSLAANVGAEGVVWHHPDGRMAKLKARDFPKVARAA